MGGGFVDPVIFEVSVIGNEAIAKFKEINNELGGMNEKALAAGGSLSTLDKAGKIATTALLAVGAAAVVVGGLSVKAAMDSEAAFARMDTAMNNAGITSKAAQEEAKKLAEANTKLGFETTQTADALGTLITATGSEKDSTALLSVAMDMARYKHESLTAAAQTLALGTQGNAKAFKEYGIQLDTSLPKQQAINKAMNELAQKVSGQNAAYLDTFAGKMTKMGTEAKLVEEKIGGFLIPIITKAMDFTAKYGEQLLILAGIFIGGAIAIKTYQVGLEVFKVAQVAYITITKGMEAGQTALTFATLGGQEATKGMTAAQWALNAAMEANPIGLVIAAVALLVAGVVILYNRYQSVRDFMRRMAADGVTAIGDLIHWFGELVTTIMKLESGPLKLLLEGLSFLHVPGAKAALNDLNGAINSTSNFFDKAAASVRDYANALSATNTTDANNPEQQYQSTIKPQGKSSSTAAIDLSNYSGANHLTAQQKTAVAAEKAAATNSKNMLSIYDAMNKAITDNATKTAAEQTNLDDAKIAANKSFHDTMFTAQRTHDQDTAKENRTNNEAIARINQSFNDANFRALQTYNDQVANLNRSADDANFKAERTYNDALAANAVSNSDAITKIQENAATARQGIIQKSIDMMTSAFSSATKIDVGSLFTVGESTSDFVTALNQKLQAAKDLAKNSAALAAKGYSQEFIQQVMSQGADTANQVATQLLGSTPDQTKAIQEAFAQLTDLQNNGVTATATSLNANGNLANQGLKDELVKNSNDLQVALKAQQDSFTDANAKALATLTQSEADTAKTLQQGLASAKQTYDQSLAANAQTLSQSLAQQQQTFNDNLSNINLTLSNSLQDATRALNDAVTAAQAAFDKNIKAISDSTTTTLDGLTAKLQAVAALITKVSGASAGVKAMAGSPAASVQAGTTPLASQTASGNTPTPAPTGTVPMGENGGSIQITQHLTVTTPQDSVAAAMDALKYGVAMTSQGLQVTYK